MVKATNVLILTVTAHHIPKKVVKYIGILSASLDILQLEVLWHTSPMKVISNSTKHSKMAFQLNKISQHCKHAANTVHLQCSHFHTNY